jgi:hypothetical protein
MSKVITLPSPKEALIVKIKTVLDGQLSNDHKSHLIGKIVDEYLAQQQQDELGNTTQESGRIAG